MNALLLILGLQIERIMVTRFYEMQSCIYCISQIIKMLSQQEIDSKQGFQYTPHPPALSALNA